MLGNTAVRRFPLVLRFWHFHIHRASVLFDLQRRFAAEGDGIQETSGSRMQVSSFRSKGVGLRGNSLPCPRLAQALWGDLTPSRSPPGAARARAKSPWCPSVTETEGENRSPSRRKPKCAMQTADGSPFAVLILQASGISKVPLEKRRQANDRQPLLCARTAPWNDCKEAARSSSLGC